MNDHGIKTLPLAALSAVLLQGCMLGPDYAEPASAFPLPDSFRGAAAASAPAATPDSAAMSAWLASWNDPLLSELVSEGLSSNLTLAAAAARLEESRAALSQSRAALFPSLGVSAGASKSRTFGPDDSAESFRAGADAGWEIDLFGGGRRSVEAAEAELEGAGYALEDARLSLAAEIASDYVALRLAQEQLEIARSNLETELLNAEIARAKGAGGLTAGADVSASEAAIASARAALPAGEQAVSSAARALEKLLARAPFGLEETLSAAGETPAPPPPYAVAPAELLARRADVRRAAAALHAATARVGVARAARYPSVNLAAGANVSSASLSDWSDAVKSLSFGPSVNIPLFNGGRLAAAEARARAAAGEALLVYHDTVLSAVHEAQDFATRLAAERSREDLLAAAVKHGEEALAAARSQYEAGRTDYTAVAVRQSALLSAKSEYARHRASAASLAVSFVKSLGGAY